MEHDELDAVSYACTASRTRRQFFSFIQDFPSAANIGPLRKFAPWIYGRCRLTSFYENVWAWLEYTKQHQTRLSEIRGYFVPNAVPQELWSTSATASSVRPCPVGAIPGKVGGESHIPLPDAQRFFPYREGAFMQFLGILRPARLVNAHSEVEKCERHVRMIDAQRVLSNRKGSSI